MAADPWRRRWLDGPEPRRHRPRAASSASPQGGAETACCSRDWRQGMYREILAVWTPLAPSPLVWIVLTIGAYLAGCWLQQRAGGAAYANTVLFAVVAVGLVVVATGTSYSTYFDGAQFINFLLGPATVALAVPLARNFHHIRRNLASIGLA